MFDSGDHAFAAPAAFITPGVDGIRAVRSEISGEADLARAAWRKSSWSSFNGNCVEVAPIRGALVGVRDTKDDGAGPVLVFTEDAWRSFVTRVKKEDAAS